MKKKSVQLKLFKGKLLDFITELEISSQVATIDEMRNRSQPYIVVGYLLGETDKDWLVGDEHGKVTKSLQKSRVASIEVAAEPTLEQMETTDPFAGYTFSGGNLN